jgi:DNA-binding transcriptional LysR family regulator
MRWNDRIGRRIKLSDLHVLLAVAQSGSMAKAATALNVSHPVVSRSISDLERQLGVRLLDRNPRGVELTAYGRAMLDRSHAAFDELRQGVKDIECLADPTAGEVRIGTTETLASSFVSTVIDRLSRRYPRIVFYVSAEGNHLRQRTLHERRADVLIYRRFETLHDDELSVESLFESPYVVAAGDKNPWVSRRRVKLADLMNELWTLPPADNPFGSFVVNAFRAGGLDLPKTTVISLAPEMRANLMRTGRYLSIVPEFWLRLPEPHQFVRKLPVELPIASAPIGIITLKNRTPSPVVQRFIECAREVAKPFARNRR